ncbi:MAG: hypothetical protein IPN33_26595 [Saprospiraceae bacterium]|nr:hypothetical protein [Saprospiraceae bacterium]
MDRLGDLTRLGFSAAPDREEKALRLPIPQRPAQMLPIWLLLRHTFFTPPGWQCRITPGNGPPMADGERLRPGYHT